MQQFIMYHIAVELLTGDSLVSISFWIARVSNPFSFCPFICARHATRFNFIWLFNLSNARKAVVSHWNCCRYFDISNVTVDKTEHTARINWDEFRNLQRKKGISHWLFCSNFVWNEKKSKCRRSCDYGISTHSHSYRHTRIGSFLFSNFSRWIDSDAWREANNNNNSHSNRSESMF